MRTKGLTLAELLLSAAILALAICGLITLFINCSFLNEASRNFSTAMNHAQYIMEEIRATAFAQVETDINNGVWDLDATAISSAPYNLAALNGETTDAEVEVSGDPLEVSLSVSWNDRRQRSRSAVLNTVLTDY